MSFESEEPLSETRIELPSRLPIAEGTGADLEARVSEAIRQGTEFLFSQQRADLHWCAELESNPTITAEYVYLLQILGLEVSERRPKIARYLLGQQNADGGWGIARGWNSDVSTAAEVYLALRILGTEEDSPAMRRAEEYILREGGIEKVRVFTRIFFAMFGLVPWTAIPSIPPEFIFLPPSSPVNIYSLSSWARGTMVPLFILFHHQPVFALPNGRSAANRWLDHLWLNPSRKQIPYAPPLRQLVMRSGISWRSFFGLSDTLLKWYDRVRIAPLRARALERCTQWVLERQESSGDWAGIFPPMWNGVVALTLQGYGREATPIRRGLEAIDRFAWEDGDGWRVQACVSPVWDTVLSAIALCDSGVSSRDPRISGALDWVIERQLLVDYGDWKVYRPALPSGGWSFEYDNSWYPDVDDTAAVVLAILKQSPAGAFQEPTRRAIEWMLGMQNRDGGWGAFDVENDKLFLNQIPFSDMDSLCDPSTPDVSGRVLEAYGLWLDVVRREGGAHSPRWLTDLRRRVERSCGRGTGYLRRTQEKAGSWFGRWGVNYIYGTSNVLCGLARIGVGGADPMIRRAVAWLREVQNPDGGWGESLASYSDPSLMGRGASSVSQTAWAAMGLLAYISPRDPAIERGIRWLVREQRPAVPIAAWHGGEAVPLARGGTWQEEAFSGTGFPNHFYLRYNYYRHYFPMMALGRYLRATMN